MESISILICSETLPDEFVIKFCRQQKLFYMGVNVYDTTVEGSGYLDTFETIQKHVIDTIHD